jgi:hypothetical protein
MLSALIFFFPGAPVQSEGGAAVGVGIFFDAV